MNLILLQQTPKPLCFISLLQGSSHQELHDQPHVSSGLVCLCAVSAIANTSEPPATLPQVHVQDINRCDIISTSWHFKFAKIKASFEKAAAKYCQINTPYTVQYYSTVGNQAMTKFYCCYQCTLNLLLIVKFIPQVVFSNSFFQHFSPFNFHISLRPWQIHESSQNSVGKEKYQPNI